MRAAIMALMLMIGSLAGAVQAIECKPGKKYLGIFVSAESPIPLPRFILDEERGWFYADEESSWRNWSNELTKTHGKGIYYLEIKKFGSKTYRKTAEMVFDRFSGEFTLTVYEEKRYSNTHCITPTLGMVAIFGADILPIKNRVTERL